MKKRSTGSSSIGLRQVVVEQPKKEIELEKVQGIPKDLDREKKSNKPSSGVRRRKTGLFVEQDTKDEIVEILNLDEEENEGLLGGKKNEEKVETVVEFGREDAWWGCCCSDLNRYKLFMKFPKNFEPFVRPWPPMWKPAKVDPDDEEDDEELDSAMMVLNKVMYRKPSLMTRL